MIASELLSEIRQKLAQEKLRNQTPVGWCSSVAFPVYFPHGSMDAKILETTGTFDRFGC
jgi:hypothetical protein